MDNKGEVVMGMFFLLFFFTCGFGVYKQTESYNEIIEELKAQPVVIVEVLE